MELKEIAEALANAIVSFFKSLDAISGDEPQTESVATEEPATSEVQTEEAELNEGYAIQLLASDKRVNGNDQQFKSYRGKVECYEGGGVLKYKYCYGEYKSREEAQRNLSTIRRTFKDAFVVHYKDGRIVK